MRVPQLLIALLQIHVAVVGNSGLNLDPQNGYVVARNFYWSFQENNEELFQNRLQSPSSTPIIM
jgi:hypothetical protein